MCVRVMSMILFAVIIVQICVPVLNSFRVKTAKKESCQGSDYASLLSMFEVKKAFCLSVESAHPSSLLSCPLSNF